MLNFTILYDATSPKNSLVKSVLYPAPAGPLEVTLGDIDAVNIYLTNSTLAGTLNGYDPASGNAAYSLKVGIGNPGALPTGGTFTLTFGGHTTSALAYNISAANLQAALVALSSIGAGNVSVTGQFPAWDVQFISGLGGAAQALMTFSSILLTPFSGIDIVMEQVGGVSGSNCIQNIELSAQPVVLQTSWTPISLNVPSAPTGGTFTLSFGGYTTAALAYNSTAAQVQSALVALTSIGANNVNVTGAAPLFYIEFVGSMAGAAETLMTSSPIFLTPFGSVATVANMQTGGVAGSNSIQTVTLAGVPTNIGWTGTLGFNTPALMELLDNGPNPQETLTTTIEFVVTDPSGNNRVVASPSITIYNRVIDEASVGTNPFQNSVSAAFNIPNGTDTCTVTFAPLILSATPSKVYLQVTKPSGGLNLWATVVQGTLSNTGFTAKLNGITDHSTYILDYVLLF